MALDVYWIALIVLAPSSVLLAGRGYLAGPLRRRLTWRWRWRRRQTAKEGGPDGGEQAEKEGALSSSEQADGDGDDDDDEARRFRRQFLQVYLLVMGSEWLQGPYTYTLLRDEKALPEATVAALYATAYASAALSALCAGFLADRLGRRRACLAFCALHALACLSVVSASLAVVFAGRVLAGAAMTLLWTVFESWMVTEHAARGLDRRPGSLAAMFGTMTTSNCTAAIVGGLLGHCIVVALGSRTHPFLAGIVLDAVAAGLILRQWVRTYSTPYLHIYPQCAPAELTASPHCRRTRTTARPGPTTALLTTWKQ